MHDIANEAVKFIDLTAKVRYFPLCGRLYRRPGERFYRFRRRFRPDPRMMSLGVPGTVAVASNMCHKFPKALVGAYKRFKYGQVDLKLGLVLAVSAGAGVQVGIKIQRMILEKWGQAGSDLYVSLSFCGGADRRGTLCSSRRVEYIEIGWR